MKQIIVVLGLIGVFGCSAPNPDPKATPSAYKQVTCGMSRDQVYALLGQPKSFEPAGDVSRCHSATWSIPHGVHGIGHWTVIFDGDTVCTVKTGHATFGIPH